MSETDQQAPAYIAPLAILGGLFIGLAAALLGLLLVYGMDVMVDVLSGTQPLPGPGYRIATLVMVLATAAGMVVIMIWAEKRGLSRNQ